MPAPQFGEETSLVRRSELVQGLSGSIRYAYPRLETTDIAIGMEEEGLCEGSVGR
jgi:hypothetical protein